MLIAGKVVQRTQCSLDVRLEALQQLAPQRQSDLVTRHYKSVREIDIMQRNGSLDRYWSTDLKALCSLSLRCSNFTDFHTHAPYVKYALDARCKAEPVLQREYFPNPLDSHVHPGKGRQKMFGKGREIHHVQSRPVRFFTASRAS